MKSISIVICTYRREDLLKECLDSIIEFGRDYYDLIEVIVVDNDCNSRIDKLCRKYNKDVDLKYVEAKMLGLSYARNKGIESSTGYYIFFLDDDAKIMEDTLCHLFKEIEIHKPDIFGGSFIRYFLLDPPIWLPRDFGNSVFISEDYCQLKEGYLTGGIFVVKKSVFEVVGLFNFNLGMKGSKIGYGEEDEFQDRARKFGFKIMFSPFFKIWHLVGRHKYCLRWHLAENYYHGYYGAFIANHNGNTNHSFLKLFIGGIYFSTVEYFKNRNYYWQNLVIDSTSTPLTKIGYLCGKLYMIYHRFTSK